MIAFILACYGVLVYQLYVWQVRDAESYRAEAVTQQLKDTTLPAVRGSIYSANGKLLAKSSTVWNIAADPFWRGPEKNACLYCDYAAACHFEEGRGGDRVRYLPALDGEAFWQAVAAEETEK